MKNINVEKVVNENIKKAVEHHNNRITKLNEDYEGKKLDMNDWFSYNEKLQPIIKDGVVLVSMIHSLGNVDYKINMQNGLIK